MSKTGNPCKAKGLKLRNKGLGKGLATVKSGSPASVYKAIGAKSPKSPL